jgi:hypothetical protein
VTRKPHLLVINGGPEDGATTYALRYGCAGSRVVSPGEKNRLVSSLVFYKVPLQILIPDALRLEDVKKIDFADFVRGLVLGTKSIPETE